MSKELDDLCEFLIFPYIFMCFLFSLMYIQSNNPPMSTSSSGSSTLAGFFSSTFATGAAA